jgi:hypothetical protein
LGSQSPWREAIARRDTLRSVEDDKGRAEHGKEDETAGEINPAKEEFGNADSGFDFLEGGKNN